MKQRIKTELLNKPQTRPKTNLDTPSQQTLEFEQTLIKLHDLQKGRLKINEFSQRDKYHLLDLFVNNERTLKAIFDALFPQNTMINQVN